MKVLIRNYRTGELFRQPNEWTTHLDEATDFQHTWQAIDVAFRCGLREAEMLLVFADPRYNITLPLHERPEQAPADLEDARRAAAKKLKY